MVDAWGKLPSGFFDGNMYDLGSFNECFDLQRGNEKYSSKYCTARLALNITGMMSPQKTYRSNLNDIFFPSDLQTDDDSIIAPRMIVPR